MNDVFPHSYFPHTQAQRAEMLAVVGVGSVDELFADIPERFRNPEFHLPPALTELELGRELGGLAKKNAVPGEYASFLGAGVYRHFIPSVVSAMISRGEFLTSYTPYQPEVSQGTLQATYEFQSLICELTGMEAANAGMYDGASAMAEAALMACRITDRDSVMVLDTVNPRYRAVLDTYLLPQGITINTVSLSDLVVDETTACILAQYPNFYGGIEALGDLADTAHQAGALLSVSANPVALGMFKAPGDYGADIVSGETQPLGVSMSFGGPFVGYFTCKNEYIRQMPGRIVGRTVDHEDRIGYVLTLQTREQHIRRERATSNICTSAALIATGTAVCIAALGPGGLRQMAELSYQKAHYAASVIGAVDGYEVIDDGTWFHEFVVKCPQSSKETTKKLLLRNIIGGLDVSDSVPNGMLFCATEMNTMTEIDALADALGQIAKGS
ncbi:MAG: aminomethyl-transferring glycine dehydrogenase subunit GcvPA [SAR202 cluster bacterium]|jgi:glycine dehydrogenase subunit 1|nr:aminomethyl-transferring glycine dehydrogenase subunit GcvPA [SAR202 cluster bacterium]